MRYLWQNFTQAYLIKIIAYIFTKIEVAVAEFYASIFNKDNCIFTKIEVAVAEFYAKIIG